MKAFKISLDYRVLVLLNCHAREESWESLGLQEIQQVNPKENQPWILIGGTDAEAEAPIFCPPDVKSWLIGKEPDSGKDLEQEERGWKKIRCLDGIIDSMDMNLNTFWDIVKYREDWHAEVHGVAKSLSQLSNSTTIKNKQTNTENQVFQKEA